MLKSSTVTSPNFALTASSQAILLSRSSFSEYFADEDHPSTVISPPAYYEAMQRQPAADLEPTAVALAQTDSQTRLRQETTTQAETAVEFNSEPAGFSFSEIEPTLDGRPVPNFANYPLLEIWLKPRATLRYLVDVTEPGRITRILLSGFNLNWILLNLIPIGQLQQGLNLSSQLSTLLLILIAGFVSGSWLWRLESTLIAQLGYRLGGRATHSAIATATLWSYLPTAIALLILGAGLGISGIDSTLADMPSVLGLLYLGIFLLDVSFRVLFTAEILHITTLRAGLIRGLSSLLVYGLPVVSFLLLNHFL
jgi:hypothetical protein